MSYLPDHFTFLTFSFFYWSLLITDFSGILCKYAFEIIADLILVFDAGLYIDCLYGDFANDCLEKL